MTDYPPFMSSYYYCIVPGCNSTNRTTPDKHFFSVPRNAKIREQWLRATRRDLKVSPLSDRTSAMCCEDHFDLEDDVENYLRYTTYKAMGFKTRATLKPGVIPHKFECQITRHVTLSKPRYSVVEKLTHQDLVRDAMAPSTSQDSPSEPEALAAGEESLPRCESPPQEPLMPSEETPMPFSDKSTQTPKYFKRPPFRSIRCQTESVEENPVTAERRLLSDAETQMTPQKKVCLEEPPISSSSSSSSSSKQSHGDPLYTPQTTTESSSIPSVDEEKKRFHSFMGEAAVKVIKRNPKFYLGVIPDNYTFLQRVGEVVNLPFRDILLSLKKLRLNQPFTALGDDFGISQSQASRIFSTTLPILAAEMQKLIYFPSQKSLAKNMPIPFRNRYSKVRFIIDCFEVKIEKPADPCNQSLTWSEYKKANTMKYLVACSPHGFVTYVSEGYCGRTTDTNLTKDSGFVDFLGAGDYIMADRGFKGLERFLRTKGIHLVRPPSVSTGEQLSPELVQESKRIASLRIHVERVIGRLRVFLVISPETHVDNKLIPMLNAAVIVICSLCNLQGPLIL